MDSVKSNLIQQIGKYYVLTQREEKEIGSVVDNWGFETREHNTLRLKRSLSLAKPITDSNPNRGAQKLDRVTSSLKGFKPSSVLDFGAGDAEVTIAAAKKYKLPKESVYAVELKPLPSSNFFTPLSDLSAIPDNSIDLILVLEVLHHVHPRQRPTIISNLVRILRPGGLIVIEEHAYNQSPGMYMSLDIYHNMWYLRNNEDYDPLYLLTEDQLQHELSTLQLHSKSKPVGWQQIYAAIYTKKIS
jgi:SAM-dependent methyltransferase